MGVRVWGLGFRVSGESRQEDMRECPKIRSTLGVPLKGIWGFYRDIEGFIGDRVFPKLREYLFRGPYSKDYNTFGSMLGPPYFGKLPGVRKEYNPIQVNRIWGIWGSYYDYLTGTICF